MAGGIATEFVAECLWPDVHEGDLRALDVRAAEESERLTAAADRCATWDRC